MRDFLIRCPRTGLMVQVSVPESTSGVKPDEYEAVTCSACARTHLVNKLTGKLLGEGLQ